MDKIKISFHGFWPRFLEDEQNNVSFFKELFSGLGDILIQNDPDKSDILVSTYGHEQELRDKAINVLYICEPSNNKEGWDLVIAGIDESKYNFPIINTPLFVSYLYCNNLLDKCLNRVPKTSIPSKFCCWITSNANCQERNNIFHILNIYKKVDSTGLKLNNTGHLLTCPWGSQEFYDYISQYKFVICAENSDMEQYITEKIFHGYISRTIPIYWGTKYMKTIFHPNSYIYLENTNEKSYYDLLNKVIEIDNDDKKWLSMINSPVFINNQLPQDLQMDTLKEKVITHIQNIKSKKFNLSI